MAQETKIQWTDITWNIARGCSKVDEDCKHCYMYRESLRATRYNPLTVVKTKTVFNLPLKIKMVESAVWPGKPLIFTSSLTDVFHPDCDSFRNEMWDIIRRCPHLIFQILTKRPERIRYLLPDDWGNGWDNVWLGTSVGSGRQESMKRIHDLMHLKATGNAKLIFLSLEPLHGFIDLDRDVDLTPFDCSAEILEYVDWVIVGGESGNDTGPYRYRPCELSWIESIVQQCFDHEVPVFVKQLGTDLSKRMKLQDRHGGNIDEFPYNIRVREFPTI